MNFLALFIGKFISKISKRLNLGHGSTWPGHIALKLNPNFVNDVLKQSKTKIILVTGTNGKTTTAKLLQTILEENNQKVFLNASGANLLNGIASSIILKSALTGKLYFNYAIFEVDENTLPQIIEKLEPDFIIALNLFRDQLDRYGEINTVAKKWKDAYRNLNKTEFILNADDPQIAYLGDGLDSKTHYFGLNDQKFEYKEQQHAADSILCPKCGIKLTYDAFYFSHLGKWKCENCQLKRPNPDLESFQYYPLLGTYAIYDTLAAVLTTQILGLSNEQIGKALKTFKPAFGRQEITEINGKKTQLFLSKNPTSFNESLRTINANKTRNLLLVLDDRIPDGTDVSWIWDIDFETLINKNTKLYLAGDRVYDLALRLKYASVNFPKENVFENLEKAIRRGLDKTNNSDIFYILPTYSAMLETRKILTGKKIL
jgi:UDP-N-acetylmuramyl tripeptide synthase